MLSLLFAACAAAANAISSVLQRKATLSAPPGQTDAHGLVANQLHRPAFLAGILGLIVAFLLQAAALSQGALTTVQSVLAAELPMTLFAASLMLHRPLGKREWVAALMMAAGLAAALAAAAPSAGSPAAGPGWMWAVAAGGTLAGLGVVATVAWRSGGPRRAALFGVVAGGTFGLTATFMSAATNALSSGLGAVFETWQLYGMVAGGMCAVGALQLAFQAGLLAAGQPGVTLTDPVVATVLGVFLFHERLRLGWFTPVEIIGVGLIVAGVLLMARSPLLSDEQEQDAGDKEPKHSEVGVG